MEKHLAAWKRYEVVEAGRPEGSAETYVRNVRQFLVWVKARPDAITQADVSRYMRALFYDFKCRSNATRAQKLSSIKAFFNYLRFVGVTKNNPAALIRSPKIEKRLPRIFSTEAIARIFSACDSSPIGIRDLALIKTIYAAGLRKSELVGLNVGDVLDSGAYIRLRVRGKGSKERMLTLRANPSKSLRAWLLSRPSTEDEALFISIDEKRRLGGRYIGEILKKYARLAGLDSTEAFIHKLRATWATNLYDSGREKCPRCGWTPDIIGVLELCALAGWDSPQTAMKYVAISDRVLKKTAMPDRRFLEIEQYIDRIRGANDE